MENTIRIAGITKESVVDGAGIRYVIYTQGCAHHCKGCHNPKTHDYTGGEVKTIKSIMEEVTTLPYLDGVTFSGGEPFDQAKSLGQLAMELKKHKKNIWAYTGYTFEYIKNNFSQIPQWKTLVEQLDFLVDGKFIETQKNLELAFRGSENQRIIDIKKTFVVGGIVLYDK